MSENLIAVGAPLENNDNGSVYLFDSDGNFIKKLVSSTFFGDEFGFDVSLNENTLLVGSALNEVYSFSLEYLN